MRFLSAVIPALLVSHVALAADRTVTDDTGRTVTVPDHPQRIVVLHEPLLGLPILDLGLPLTGSYGRSDDGEILTAVDFIETVFGSDGPARPPGIGAIGHIDLERLRKLDPDLIIGTERDLDKAGRLSTVAPVFLQNSSAGSVHGFGAEKDLATLVNEDAAFDAREEVYRQRLAQVRSGLAFDPQDLTYLAIIVRDDISLVGGMSGAIQAIEDLGYTQAALETGSVGQGLGSTFSVPLSPEVFGRINPDLLILMGSYSNTDRSAASIRASLDKVLPGWDRFLAPARDGRILYLDPSQVATPTVASALHTLDTFDAWAEGR